MDIFKKISNKIHWYKYRFFVARLIKQTIEKIKELSTTPRIYYFLTPTHSNLGDQAQLLCWLNLFKKWYPTYNVITLPLIVGTDEVFERIREKISEKDMIFIHSGYLVCDLYNNWQMLCKVVDTFPNHKITILPQTVHFLNQSIQDIVASSFNKHKNLHLICRDEVSYVKARHIFPNIDVSLKPDVVTSLIGTDYVQESINRDGLLFCMRNDAEKLYSNEQINGFMSKLKGVNIDFADTTISASAWDWVKGREKIIQAFLVKFSNYQVIVTDRYHGTIFSQIVDTPVVVLASSDHKLKSGVDWFPKEMFGNNIMFAKDLNEAYQMVQQILSRKGKIIKNPSYFLDSYYSKPL